MNEKTQVVFTNLPPVQSEKNKKNLSRDSRLGLEHVGLLYLQEILRTSGIGSDVLDFAFDSYHQNHEEEQDYVPLILNGNPSIVGFSPYVSSIAETLEASRKIKEQSPKTKIILGGSHASHTAEDILSDNPFIDAIFLGEAFGTIVPGVGALLEEKTPDIREGIVFRRGERIVNTEWPTRTDLDSLPVPKREEEMYLGNKTASMMFSVGCPAACSFCSAEGLRDHSWRTHSPQNLFQEIKYLRETFKVDTIETHSDDAFGPTSEAIDRYTQLARMLIPLQINWRTTLRATDLKEGGKLDDISFWKLLKESGLERAYLGFEAGTDERLKKLRKPATTEINKRAFNFLREQGIAVQYGFIMFFPDSTTEELRQNQDFLYSIGNHSYSRASSSLMVLPGSRYFDEFKKDGKLQKPYYLPQRYSFEDSGIEQICRDLQEFDHEQRGVDSLCLDLDYASVNGRKSVTHFGLPLRVDTEFMKERTFDLHTALMKVLEKPERAGQVLGDFNSVSQIKYGKYLKENG